MNEPIRVFIVDDNLLFCESLASMLAEQEGIVVTGTAASGGEAQEQIKALRSEVVLIDIGMTAEDAIEMTHALHRDLPEVKVIILGMVDVTDKIMACIEAGAAGYVLKDASFVYLVEMIRSVHRGESFCSPRVAASLFSRIAELTDGHLPRLSQSSARLTARELEIIKLIDEGLPNKEIAKRLTIEAQTVKTHIHNILDKLQLHNRVEAAKFARERKLLK
ncbi:MAG: LuxR C-terminal-related transcriptional regulator, partial [bacterium]